MFFGTLLRVVGWPFRSKADIECWELCGFHVIVVVVVAVASAAGVAVAAIGNRSNRSNSSSSSSSRRDPWPDMEILHECGHGAKTSSSWPQSGKMTEVRDAESC